MFEGLYEQLQKCATYYTFRMAIDQGLVRLAPSYQFINLMNNKGITGVMDKPIGDILELLELESGNKRSSIQVSEKEARAILDAFISHYYDEDGNSDFDYILAARVFEAFPNLTDLGTEEDACPVRDVKSMLNRVRSKVTLLVGKKHIRQGNHLGLTDLQVARINFQLDPIPEPYIPPPVPKPWGFCPEHAKSYQGESCPDCDIVSMSVSDLAKGLDEVHEGPWSKCPACDRMVNRKGCPDHQDIRDVYQEKGFMAHNLANILLQMPNFPILTLEGPVFRVYCQYSNITLSIFKDMP